MKVMVVRGVLAGALIMGVAASAQAAGGISGSPHDLTSVMTNALYGTPSYAWNSRRGTCTPCHSAHNTADVQIVPLWAHKNSTASFVPYGSPTLDAAVDQQPSGISLACLSCHDGSVALNEGISAKIGSATAALQYIDAGAKIGPDLHTTHPISFVYNGGLASADGGLEDPDAYKIGDPKNSLTVKTAPVPSALSGGWSGTSLTGKSITDTLLFDGRMECSSCHDVHKQDGSAPSSGILVRISGYDSDNRGSLICRTCHIK